MATLHVELVAVERMIWSGEANMVVARTTEGELGVLPGHAPLLGQLAEGAGDDPEALSAAKRAQSRLRAAGQDA